jgi:hypothetical protein
VWLQCNSHPLLHQGILQYKTITGALHDQHGRSEQMDGHTHEDRSSDNTARTLLDVKKHVLFLGLTFFNDVLNIFSILREVRVLGCFDF